MRVLNIVLVWMAVVSTANAQAKLAGHWPLQSSADDHSPGKLKSIANGVKFTDDGPTKSLTKSAVFDGTSSFIEIDAAGGFNPGKQEFSIAAWVKPSDATDDVPGEIR